ncbi:MAG: cadmium-translocating P-type ATPase [Clostridiales bacterium]|nr:cadmium-translocating P-type ATPase [Clostridiales bacterium]
MKSDVEFKLDGLNCAHCAEKIEENVKKLDKIDEAYLNFMNKEISIKLKNIKDKNIVVNEIVNIVKKFEPTVNVYEKNKEKNPKKFFTIGFEGLNCAHCGMKIEESVKKIEKVQDASLNFMNKEIVIRFKNLKDKKRIIDEVTEIVKKIEPGVKVFERELKEDFEEEIRNGATVKLVRLSVGLVLFAMGIIIDMPDYINLTLFIAAYLITGYDVIWSALLNITKGQIFDEKFLMFIATFCAFFIKEYNEAVAVMIFYQLGEFFQDRAVEKSRKSIKGLMNIVPETTTVVDGEDVRIVKPQDVEIGDIIVVKAGDKVPVDGIISEGNSFIDMSALIGESLPKSVSEGDEVLSGSINQSGVLKVKAVKKYESSTVSKILNLVENAGSKKSKTENFITKFAKIYSPAVVLSAAIIALFPTLIMGFETFGQWLERALIFLVSSCPCALIISIPLGFFSGIGYASKRGILIKGSSYLQTMREVRTVVFDKTGTITKGVFSVEKILTRNMDEKTFMKLAYSVEKLSNHPVAKAVVTKYEADFGKDCFEVLNFEEIGGYGIVGEIEGKKIIVGNFKLMKKYNINAFEEFTDDTNIFVSYDNEFSGEILVCDTIKEDSFSAIKKLKERGLKTIMLTGDKKETAVNVARKLSIDEIYSDMLPQNKVEKLEEIMAKNKSGKVLFVGDGINDAPVLAMADVGAAMGGVGSDAAIEAADIVIMNDELSKIDDAIRISKNTLNIIKQNIGFVLVVKFIVLILAAFGFATMWLAVFADVGVALLAVLNSMRKK